MIMKGQKINDRYKIIKNVGEGGMANVYLAYDTILDRNVAIKVLRGDLAADEKFVRRFQREALSASSLAHPNIVEVYDVGEDSGQYYIVMEYVEGKHLKALIKKRGTLTVSEVIDIMIQITEGLAQAHDSYIIHRDIKPQNILILENGLVKITDFGVAMAINSTQLTQTNSVMGTVHYLPPEQASGKGSTLKSDIYSLGILMYELLCGQLPYKGDNAVEIALKHLKEEMPSIKEKLPNLPQSVENVILKSIAKNPKNRYNDAREMNEDLKTVLADERMHEPRYIYPYPETEFDDKALKKIEKEAAEEEEAKPAKEAKKEEPKEEEAPIAKKITKGDLKKQNKLLITLGAIFAGLVVIITTLIFLLPVITGGRETEVPDVRDYTISDAIRKLQNAGFRVADEQREVSDDEIEEGRVARTNPAAGSRRTRGTTITLFIAISGDVFVMEDFIGRNYLEVRARLEAHGIHVLIEKKEVDDNSNHRDTEIIAQSVDAGTRVSAGDTVTLFIPDIITKYPNFTDGSWDEAKVRAFAEEFNINLEVEQVETGEHPAGAVIWQSRPEGFTVTPGVTLRIRVARAVTGGEDCIPGLGIC